MEALLSVQDLSVGYAGRQVLSAVSFTIMPGERWFLVGANGSGKSTLLKTLAGVLPALSGKRKQPPPQRLGYVPQHSNVQLDVPSTAHEVICLGLVCSGVRRRDWNTCIDNVCERMAIDSLLRKTFSELSGGEKQKILLARALVRNPKLLLLDEPFAHLDADSGRAIFQVIERFTAEEGGGALIVSHDQLLPDERVLRVSSGRILEQKNA